jgi:hypothetical protein
MMDAMHPKSAKSKKCIVIVFVSRHESNQTIQSSLAIILMRAEELRRRSIG